MSGPYYGDFPTSHTGVCMTFDSFAASTGAPSATTNFAAGDIQIYKDGSNVQRSSSAGIVVTTSFDSQTGLQMATIDLSDNTDAGFYAAGHEYSVAVADITVDSQTLRFWLGSFSIERAGGVLALIKARTPNAAAGASGGLLISGSNSGTTTFAALTVTGSLTVSDGLLIARSTSNASAITATGNGTGNGAVFTSGSGATGDAVQMTAASTNGKGLNTTGSGTGQGFLSTGGASSAAGAKFVGGETGGSGLDLRGATGGTGAGLFVNAAGAGATGVSINAGSSGFGIAIASASTGLGITSSAGKGMIVTGATADIDADILGTLTTVTNLTTYTGNTPQTGDSFARIGATGSGLTSITNKTDNLPSDPADESLIIAATDAIIAAVAAVQADLPQKITKNVALAAFPFFMADSTDHVSGKTGLTVTAERSLDGAAFGACANAAAEIGNGWYKISLAAGDLNANTVALKFTATGADATNTSIITQPT